MYLSDKIQANVLVANVLKNLTRKLPKFIALSMDEMTKVPTSATRRSMEVLAGHSSIVGRLYHLIGIRLSIQLLLRILTEI